GSFKKDTATGRSRRSARLMSSAGIAEGAATFLVLPWTKPPLPRARAASCFSGLARPGGSLAGVLASPPDEIEQFGPRARLRGLDQVVMEAGFPGAAALLFLADPRHGPQYQRPFSRLAAQLLGELVAVHPRHGQVEQGHLGLKRAGQLQAG